ncbi:hypothetical protein GGI25_003342 [Coemansia spiralis]|uniref:DUF726-domain-containing protein n=2 Tax=Coemansia TaxID=4863 RepID=A0A9W8G8N0_9FUNG|nr:hypothetical protein EDC05_006008 [Coemansia umbellata]KAJ2621659.1 hypothetical protein GGI26_003867 [Coemansia sp. RSA 1358]KAJ2676807.1 hypothetical protein GGI25_003342 [Coemansia spiralis]
MEAGNSNPNKGMQQIKKPNSANASMPGALDCTCNSASVQNHEQAATPVPTSSSSPMSLGSAPTSMAFKYDRRRDFFTDTSTLAAAMGNSAPKDVGVRYDKYGCTSTDPNTLPRNPTAHRHSPSIAITHIGMETAFGNSAAGSKAKRTATSRRSGQNRLRNGSGGKLPLFRRSRHSGSTGAPIQVGEYGSDSHLPRFMLDRLRSARSTDRPASTSTDGFACSSGRTSVASSDSVMCSPKSASSASPMQGILELEEAKLLEAERKSQMRAVDSILSEEQKIAYVGLIYLLLVDMQERLNVQFKESQTSTASFMNFSRRLMRKMYAHIRLSAEEQRMVEMLPRHKIVAADMALSLAAQGDTIYVEADQDLAVMHTATDEELINALRESCEERSSTESTRGSRLGWLGRKKTQTTDDTDIYSQYSMLPTQGVDPVPDRVSEDECASHPASEQVGSCSSQIASVCTNGGELATTEESKSSAEGASAVDGEDSKNNNIAGTSSEKTTPPDNKASTSDHLERRATDVLDDDDDVTLTKIGAEQPLAIDVRATLILDLFLLLLSDDVYDGRGRYLLRRLAEALKYPWTATMQCERRVTRQLALHDYAVDLTSATKNATTSAVKERSEKGRKKRLVIIGLATVGGGLVIGLSAGLLAPAIGAGIGATLGAIGVANTGAFFGSIGGTALITGAATLTGSGMAGRQITRRTRFAEQFEFIPCINEKQTNLILTIPGWLGKADNGVFSFSKLHPVNGDHCSLLWEADAMRRLGSSLRMIVGEVFSITLTQTLQHTILPSLLGPLSIPMWLAKLGYVLDNPWSSGCDLASNAGPVIADLLLQRVQGQRPVTLIGYSIGARLIFYTLLELAKMNAYGLVEDVYLFGAPIVASEEEWRTAASVVGGRFVNAYSTKDWILGFFYRTTNLGRRSVAGLHPISGINSLENFDVSEDVPGHIAYRGIMPKLLQKLGVPVTGTELYDPNESLGDNEDDRAMIAELEKAAEMLEEHERKKKNVWPRRWAFWETGSTSQAATESSGTLARARSNSVSLATVSDEVDAAARELAALGVGIKEMPSTMPALIVENGSGLQDKNHPLHHESGGSQSEDKRG